MEAQEFEKILHDADVKLARLKALYEQWFQGIEKAEPTVARKDLDRTFDLLKRAQPRNTALRFKLQMLWARYGTYITYWGRISRQIEEGTYRRDLMRARQRRQAAREARQGGAIELDIDVDEVEDLSSFSFDESDMQSLLGELGSSKPPPREPERAVPADAPVRRAPSISPFASFASMGSGGPTTATFAKPRSASQMAIPAAAIHTEPPARGPAPPAAPPRPAPAPRAEHPASRAAPASRGEGIDEGRMRHLYQSYVDARRRNNEPIENVRYETLRKSVEQMVPKLREKHGDRAIDFEVVVQGGRVGLKPKIGS